MSFILSNTFSPSGMIRFPDPSVRRIPRESTASGKDPVACGSQIIAGVESLCWLKISRAWLLDCNAAEEVERGFVKSGSSDIDASEAIWFEPLPSPRLRFEGLIPRDENDIALLFCMPARDWETPDTWSSQFSILTDDELDIAGNNKRHFQQANMGIA